MSSRDPDFMMEASTQAMNNSTAIFPGKELQTSCNGLWGHPHHLLFQMAHAALLLAYLSPNSTYGILFLHGMLVLGFLLLSTWAWVILCAPDIFSWNFSFMIINAVQMLFIMYRLRPVKFSPELEDVYSSLFQPLKVPRQLFKKLVSSDYATVQTLHQGESYAVQDITKTDRLSVLITGAAKVMCNGLFLHNIHEKQFLDSPEFESTSHGDEKFQVSIIGVLPGYYVAWQRVALSYLFVKEPYIATVMGIIIGRDITNKLYALNDKLKTSRGNRVDIRLPSVSTAAMSGADLKALGMSDQKASDTSGVEGLFSGEEEDVDEDVFEETDEKARMFPNGSLAPRTQQLSGSPNSSSSSMRLMM